MPSEDGLRLDQEEGLSPVGPEAQQAHPQQSVGGPEFRFGRLPLEDCELMPERQVFKRQSGMGLEAGEQRAEKRRNDLEHGEADFGRGDRNLNVFERLRGFRYPHRVVYEGSHAFKYVRAISRERPPNCFASFLALSRRWASSLSRVPRLVCFSVMLSKA